MIKRAAEEMGMEGRTHWSEDTLDGNSVDISMKAMYGKSPVYIDPELCGDEMCFIRNKEDGTSRLMITPGRMGTHGGKAGGRKRPGKVMGKGGR